MTKVIRNQKKVKASWMVINRLQGMICRKELRPGDKLPPERDLAREFEVSRPTVRGAIQPLVSIGVLRSRQGSGTFVVKAVDWLVLDSDLFQLFAQFNRFSSEEIFEARNFLEMIIAGLAAENATGEDLAAIAEELVEMFSTRNSPSEFLNHNLKFHQKIAAASQNRILAAMLNMLISILYEYIQTESIKSLNVKETIRSRQEIYRAIRNRDPEVARQLMQKYLLNTKVVQESEI